MSFQMATKHAEKISGFSIVLVIKELQIRTPVMYIALLAVMVQRTSGNQNSMHHALAKTWRSLNFCTLLAECKIVPPL